MAEVTAPPTINEETAAAPPARGGQQVRCTIDASDVIAFVGLKVSSVLLACIEQEGDRVSQDHPGPTSDREAELGRRLQR